MGVIDLLLEQQNTRRRRSLLITGRRKKESIRIQDKQDNVLTESNRFKNDGRNTLKNIANYGFTNIQPSFSGA